MDNTVKFYEEQLKIEQDGLQQISEKIAPLEHEKGMIEENMKALKHLIESEKRKIMPATKIKKQLLTGSLTGKSGFDAYKELVLTYFKDKPFREKDIREYAIKEGLIIKGKPIGEVYSRSLIPQLIKKGLIVIYKRGLYKHIEQEQDKPSEQQETTSTKLRKRLNL